MLDILMPFGKGMLSICTASPITIFANGEITPLITERERPFMKDGTALISRPLIGERKTRLNDLIVIWAAPAEPTVNKPTGAAKAKA
ncbi:MAG: hypothetical protein Q9P01_12940 [Anaerolineae bacterium]|nr:hypothetical protein [Anaerolineae bacterium]